MLTYTFEKATTVVVAFARPREMSGDAGYGTQALVRTAVGHRIVSPNPDAVNTPPVSGMQLWSHPPV